MDISFVLHDSFFWEKLNFQFMLIRDFYLGPRQTAIFITIVGGFAADIVGTSNNDSLFLSVIGCH